MKNTKLKKSQVLELKSKLKRKKRRKADQLSSIKGLIKDQKEYIKRSDMDYDSDASKIRNREMLQNMKRRAQRKIRKFDTALNKIEAGTYGVCEKTGRNISYERLNAMPEAKTCISKRPKK